MQLAKGSVIQVENTIIDSVFLKRLVKLDIFIPSKIWDPPQMSLLLINDGQDMQKMGFESILDKLYSGDDPIEPLICVAIHCGPERKMEYGVAGMPDYKGFG